MNRMREVKRRVYCIINSSHIKNPSTKLNNKLITQKYENGE
jgi:hypothetical protein